MGINHALADASGKIIIKDRIFVDGGLTQCQLVTEYLGLFETSINQDEIVVGIKYPLLKQGQSIVFDEVCRRHGDYAMAGLIAYVVGSKNEVKDLKLVFFATGDKPDIADKTAELYLDNGYDYDKLKNSLSSEIDFAGDLNSSSEMKLHLATVLIKKVLSKLEI